MSLGGRKLTPADLARRAERTRGADARLAEIRRRHRPGFDPRGPRVVGQPGKKQCVRCHTPWPCDAAWLAERLDS